MTMNIRLFIFSAAAIVFAACSPMESPVGNDIPVSLSYSAVGAIESKAAQDLNEGTFESGESVRVRISNTGEGSWTDYTFTTGDAGAMTPPSPGPYYPAGSQNIDIVAYYPATAGTSFSVATDQTADADYKAGDLMFASVPNQAKQAAAVELTFTHKMAKLKVNIMPGSGVNSITGLRILNVKPTVSFNPATGEVGVAGGDAIAITMSNGGAAVIPAQTIDGGFLSIVTDKGTATYSVAGKEFCAGHLYTINITVNLRAVGATTAITGWTSEGTVTVNPVTNQKTPAGLEAVDMGSGLKWANMNVGAVDSVTDYGDYFAWGETAPYYQEGYAQENPCTHWIGGKSSYVWESYSLCNGTTTTMIKYCTSSNYGCVDNKTELERTHDAAHVNWGGTWRTPTYTEWNWLRENSTWTWTDDYLGDGSNKAGSIVTSSINGNTIFLPASGERCGNELIRAGKGGAYWSSTLEGSCFAWSVVFDRPVRVFYVNFDGYSRYFGLPVRAVSE